MQTITYYRQELAVVKEQSLSEAVHPRIATVLTKAGVETVLTVRKINGRRLHRLYKLVSGEYQEA